MPHAQKSPHKRGLEQICRPFDLTTAISPAVTPAHITEDTMVCAFRPAWLSVMEVTVKPPISKADATGI